MHALRVVLVDQLSLSISSLKDSSQSKDIILMCEVWQEASYVKHHKKKLAFLFSAMRHFAKQLEKSGFLVLYTKLDDPKNTQSLKGEVARVLEQYKVTNIIVTHPGEYRILDDIQSWKNYFKIPIEIRADDRFLCGMDEFADWAKERKQLRMEYFYRKMRKKYAILMDGDTPVGSQWNFDSENRASPKEGMDIPKPYSNNIDDITSEVIAMITKNFSNHFGDIQPFYFAVTREQALDALNLFIKQRLKYFGEYQDAMLEGEPWMYHSHISFYLNAGLLLPLECIKLAEYAYNQHKVPLNAVEGFIRQIIGWREYIRGIYWLKMPDYAQENFFEAKRCLPDFYWTADTKMNCLHQCVLETKQNAYAHHIQRLMVLGNFALITGIDPVQVNEWFLIVYADAYEWVELPNVSGMILFADGGYLASKPYAAGGSYINKMSNYCKSCSYKVTKKSGPDACPFNYLYWNFMLKNRHKLASNNRLRLIYSSLDKMDDSKKKKIIEDSEKFLHEI